MFLRLGDPPSPVPEPVASLLLNYIATRDNMNTATNRASRWLFPGRRADQPCQRFLKFGSGTLSVIGPWSVGQQNAFTQKIGVGAAVHLSLEHFGAIDVPFDGSGAVGQGESGGDSVLVPA